MSAAVLAAHQDGFQARGFDLNTGSLWVPSTGPGQLALLDGTAGEVTVRIGVADPADDLVAVQSPVAGFAVNRTRGTITRVDAATWRVAEAQVLPNSTTGLTAITAGQSLFAIDVQRGVVIKANPATLQPIGREQSLSSANGTALPIADSRGQLWLLDQATGDLIRMAETPQRTAGILASGAAARLVLAAGDPAVVDLTNRSVTRIEPNTGKPENSACVDTQPDDTTLSVAGSNSRPEVYVVSGTNGVLRITNLDTGECHSLITVAAAGSELGEPIEVANRVYVPNYTTGQVVVVDLDSLNTPMTTPPVTDAGRKFDLISHDGLAFYNDRASDKAGVINADGTIHPIAKYDVDDPGKGLHLPAPELSGTDNSASDSSPSGNSEPSGTSEPTSSGTPDPGDTTDPDRPPPSSTRIIPRPSTANPPIVTRPPPSSPPPSSTPSSKPPPSSPPPVSSPLSPAPALVEMRITITGEGTVTDAANGISCTANSSCPVTAKAGTPLNLLASPVTLSWSGDCEPSGPTCRLTATDGAQVTAAFTSPELSELHITVVGAGRVDVDRVDVDRDDAPDLTCDSECRFPLPVGEFVTLTAVPAPGIEFTSWANVHCVTEVECREQMGIGEWADNIERISGAVAVFREPEALELSVPELDLRTLNEGSVTLTLRGGSGFESWVANSDNRLLQVTPRTGSFVNRTATVAVTLLDETVIPPNTLSETVTFTVVGIGDVDVAVETLRIQLPTTPELRAAGSTRLAGTWQSTAFGDCWDLDLTIFPDPSCSTGRDITFSVSSGASQSDVGPWQVVPAVGAAIGTSVDFRTCNAALNRASSVDPISRPPVGTIICIRTDAGRIGAVKITAEPAATFDLFNEAHLGIDWTTWE